MNTRKNHIYLNTPYLTIRTPYTHSNTQRKAHVHTQKHIIYTLTNPRTHKHTHIHTNAHVKSHSLSLSFSLSLSLPHAHTHIDTKHTHRHSKGRCMHTPKHVIFTYPHSYIHTCTNPRRHKHTRKISHSVCCLCVVSLSLLLLHTLTQTHKHIYTYKTDIQYNEIYMDIPKDSYIYI